MLKIFNNFPLIIENYLLKSTYTEVIFAVKVIFVIEGNFTKYFFYECLASDRCSYCEDPEKALETHSSTLAWKIPWTEEPGRLQSMGSLRVRHD